MRKYRLFFVLLFSLIVPPSITLAQTIQTQKGLTTAVFPTTYGNIKVYLPDDIRPGDLISGTVVAEPGGKNSKQIERNLSQLKNYAIVLEDGNSSYPATGILKYGVQEKPVPFKWLVHYDRKNTAPIELLSPSGIKEGTLKIPIRPSAPRSKTTQECSIPSHALTDAPYSIPGNFDGNYENTRCLLNNQPLELLAESPRQCQVMYPQTGQGLQTMQVKESGQEKCTRQVSGVEMLITTGDMNLRKGQNTFIDIKLTGLQNLADTAWLRITNITPGIVTMTNGNLQVIPVLDDPDDMDGVFSVHCPAVSIATGTFVVKIHLDLPEPVNLYEERPGSNSDNNKQDSVPCQPGAEDVKKAEDAVQDLERELAGIDGLLDAAKKKNDDCKAALALALNEYNKAKAELDKQKEQKRFFEVAKKEMTAKAKKKYDEAQGNYDDALKKWQEQNEKCKKLDDELNKLEKRKESLPGLIKDAAAAAEKTRAEADKCRQKEEEERRKKNEEEERREEQQRQKTQAEKDAQDAKQKSKAENIYLLQNIHSLGLISSKIWETPGLMDWLPEVLGKPVGDAAEELVKTPIPLDAITALAGLYSVVGAKLDPCTAEGSITTIKRLKGMNNSKTGRNYTEDEALDKTDRMCELLKKLKEIAAAAKGKK